MEGVDILRQVGDYFRGDSGPPPPLKEMDNSVDVRVKKVASEYLQQWEDLRHDFGLLSLAGRFRDNMEIAIVRLYNKGIHQINNTQREYADYIKDLSAITSQMAGIVEDAKRNQIAFRADHASLIDREKKELSRIRERTTIASHVDWPDDKSSLLGPQSKSYTEAFTDGLIAGFGHVATMIAHPIDTLIVPPVDFVIDFSILGAKGYLDALKASRPDAKLREELKMDPSLVKRTHDKMQGRMDELELLKDAFVQGSGPERVEIATTLATTMAVAHRTIISAGSIAKVPSRWMTPSSTLNDPHLGHVMSHLRALPSTIDDMIFFDLAENLQATRSTLPSRIKVAQDVVLKSYTERVTLISFKEDTVFREVVRKTQYPHDALSEICHLDQLAQTLTFGKVPQILGIDMKASAEWDLYLSKAPGKTMFKLLEENNLSEVQEGFYHLGKVLGEMDTKEIGPLSSIHAKAISQFPETYQFVSDQLQMEYNLKLPYAREEIIEITRQFEGSSPRSFLSHDDPHLNNFLWDADSRQLTVLDIGSRDVTRGSKFTNDPQGQAFYDLLGEINEETASRPLPASSIKKAYIKGYEEVSGVSFQQHQFMKIYSVVKRMWGVLDDGLSKKEVIAILRALTEPV